MKEIKRQEGSVKILVRATCNDENYNPCRMVYTEFEKAQLQKFFELKVAFDELKRNHGICHIAVSDYFNWIEETPDELEALNEELDKGDYIPISGLDDDFLDKNECRTEYDEVHVYDVGILFKAWIKHTTVEVCSSTLSWDFLKECLNNCDPQSIRFIRDDKPLIDPDDTTK